MLDNEEGGACKLRRRVIVRHCNIIEAGFWEAHPQILNEKPDRFEAQVIGSNGQCIND